MQPAQFGKAGPGANDVRSSRNKNKKNRNDKKKKGRDRVIETGPIRKGWARCPRRPKQPEKDKENSNLKKKRGRDRVIEKGSKGAHSWTGDKKGWLVSCDRCGRKVRRDVLSRHHKSSACSPDQA